MEERRHIGRAPRVPCPYRSRTARLVRLLPLAVAALAACAPRTLVLRAIDARGGPIAGLVRRSEVRVHAVYPGRWRWRTVFAAPDRYAWTVETTGEPTHYLWDGTLMRSFVGSAEVAAEPSSTAPLRSHARLTGAMLLDALLVPGPDVRELSPGERPPGAAAALAVVFPDDGARYVVAFDRHLRVVSVEGPVDLSPYGRGMARVALTDHRLVDRRLLPHRLSWTLDGRPLADERMVAACVLASVPAPDRFQRPETVPSCAR